MRYSVGTECGFNQHTLHAKRKSSNDKGGRRKRRTSSQYPNRKFYLDFLRTQT